MPLEKETRWSDLLAVLIEADRVTASTALGLRPPLRQPLVRREATGSGRDRGDLLIYDDNLLRAVIEVKVLAGLGRGQLARYRQNWPGAEVYVLISPQRLPVYAAADAGWTQLGWEQVLDAFAGSEDPWVARTAAAWRAYLEEQIPPVNGATRWNGLHDGEHFVRSLRTRMSWVYGALDPPPPIEHDLVISSAGVSWVARLNTPAKGAGYLIRVEAEERLPVRKYPNYASPTAQKPLGPSVKVCLVQTDVRTSKNFNWNYLLALWPLMAAARTGWVTTAPRPRAPHDREGQQRLRAAGGPRFLGIGFGEAQARRFGECMFGARFQLAPDVRLDQVVAELMGTVPLALDLAAVEEPPPFDA